MLEDGALCFNVDEMEVSLSCSPCFEAASPSPITVLELSCVSLNLRFISLCERFLVAVGISGRWPTGGELGGDGVLSFICVEILFNDLLLLDEVEAWIRSEVPSDAQVHAVLSLGALAFRGFT